MKEQKSKKLKVIIIVLAILLAISAAALTGTLLYNYFSSKEPASVVLPGNIITPDSEDSSESENPAITDLQDDNSQTTAAAPFNAADAGGIFLDKRNPHDDEPFEIHNMFPGDKITKYYCVEVAHKGTVTVDFHADIHHGGEKVENVLKMKVRLIDTDETLYDGLVRDMPDALKHRLYTSTAVQDELYYEITAYLDTSVGNEYMDQELITDFKWWVEETDNLISSPFTGFISGDINLWALMIAVVLFVVLIFMLPLFVRRRKEAVDEK